MVYPIYRFANSGAKGRAGERDGECRPAWKTGLGYGAMTYGVSQKIMYFLIAYKNRTKNGTYIYASMWKYTDNEKLGKLNFRNKQSYKFE